MTPIQTHTQKMREKLYEHLDSSSPILDKYEKASIANFMEKAIRETLAWAEEEIEKEKFAGKVLSDLEQSFNEGVSDSILAIRKLPAEDKEIQGL